MKNRLVFQGKYGATQQYANWLAEELQMPAIPSDQCDIHSFTDGDLLIMGSSVYIGKLQIAGWITLNKARLEKQRLVLFVVSGTPLDQTTKLWSYVRKSIPSSLLKECRVFFLPGRLNYSKLSKRDRFMLRVGAWLAGKNTGAKMLAGYDDVRREHLQEIIAYLKPLVSINPASAVEIAMNES